MVEAQDDPPLPSYSPDTHLMIGLAPIETSGYLDFSIDRPLSMEGYILNLTIRGKGVIDSWGKQFICRLDDIPLFPPEEIHHYGRHSDASKRYYQQVYFRPRAYWQGWLTWPVTFDQTGLFCPDEVYQPYFNELFGQIISAGQGEDRYPELLTTNSLEQLLLRRIGAINESLHPPMDNHVRDTCQYINGHPADNNFDITNVVQHVYLSSSRLPYLFRQQSGISALSWHEDQCISQAKLLLDTVHMPTTTVGRNVGLDDQPYLFRVLKKRTGASPDEFCARCEQKVNGVS